MGQEINYGQAFSSTEVSGPISEPSDWGHCSQKKRLHLVCDPPSSSFTCKRWAYLLCSLRNKLTTKIKRHASWTLQHQLWCLMYVSCALSYAVEWDVPGGTCSSPTARCRHCHAAVLLFCQYCFSWGTDAATSTSPAEWCESEPPDLLGFYIHLVKSSSWLETILSSPVLSVVFPEELEKKNPFFFF